MLSRWSVVAVGLSMSLLAWQTQADTREDQAAELAELRQRVKALEERLAADVLPPAATPAIAESQNRVEFFGDARYRAENGSLDGVHNDRQRVRARVGAEARINDRLSTVFRLSTGEGDPRSAHLTFSGGYSRRSVGVDLAYLQWQAIPDVAVSAGKVVYPNWQPAQSVFIGGDFNPEGWSASYRGESGWFSNAHSFWLQTRGDAGDSRQNGLQVGFGSDRAAPASVIVSAAYTDFISVRGERPFLDGVNAYGNSVDATGAFAQDFNIGELASELTLQGYPGSLTFFTHLARNTAASQDDTAYSVGLSVQGARFKSWHLGYQYARIEKDALFGQLMDGDFGGGSTDTRGHAFRIGYRPEGRWSSSLSYLRNKVGIATATPRPFDLIQLDIDFTY